MTPAAATPAPYAALARGLLLLAALLAAAVAQAAGPTLKTQPGYYRMMLGDFEVTALSDGTLELPVDDLLRTGKKRTANALARKGLASPVETSVNAYLINTGAKLVLIDAGAGTSFGPTLGKLVASLQAAGYTTDQVDEIYITHMHGDHLGGITADGKAVYPNAIVRVEQKDADFWLDTKTMEGAPQQAQGFFKIAMAAVAPYQAAGRFRPFAGETELVPGIRAVPARGHTPGHMVYIVESRGQKLVLWGDIMHVAAVQFPDPSVTITFDTDSRAAAVARRKVFADAAKRGLWVGAAHVSFPGLGKLRPDGKGYDWIPANYSVPR